MFLYLFGVLIDDITYIYTNRKFIMQFRKYTQEQFIDAVLKNTSMRQTLLFLNVCPYGGNYDTARKYIKQLNLDISHWHGQSWAKGKKLSYLVKSLDKYLNGDIKIQSYKLKLRLLRDKIFPIKCMICNLETWLNNIMPLELHHIDGNSNNNKLDNLQLLCPNCHSLTPNYRAKNK